MSYGYYLKKVLIFKMKTGLLIIIILIIVFLVGGIYFLTQGSYKTPTNNPNTNSAPTSDGKLGSSTHNIEISDFAFNPSTLTIKKGDKVIWTNKDSANHPIKSDSGSEISSNSLSKGETYSHTFISTGTFVYHCSVHPYMKATIVVE